MKLFEDEPAHNLLPFQGEVNYYGPLFSISEADFYFEHLFNSLEWRNDEAIIFGKRIVTARKVAWYGNEPFPYRYSGTTKYALAWTAELQAIKVTIETRTGLTFNSCLANLYHTGEEGMAWHSDNEPELLKNGAIASISLGAERKFAFKHKKENISRTIELTHGSLLIMKGETQQHWLHRLPPTKKVKTARINLTFRTINDLKK